MFGGEVPGDREARVRDTGGETSPSCRVCGNPLIYSGRGRPRRLCTECRPSGAPKPTKAATEFRRTFGATARRLSRDARARRAARAAAARRTARACPDLYLAFLADEYDKRGVA